MKSIKNSFAQSARLLIWSLLLLNFTSAFAQHPSPESLNDARREQKKNLIIREYNTDAKGQKNWLDHITIYNENGYKIQEAEYAVYGLRTKTMYEYDANNQCVKEVEYDSKNKVTQIKKFTYNADGTRKTQYNYLPNGRLHSTKQYEYATSNSNSKTK